MIEALPRICPGGGMVYTHDLKSCSARIEGSSPSPGTNKFIYLYWDENAGAMSQLVNCDREAGSRKCRVTDEALFVTESLPGHNEK